MRLRSMRAACVLVLMAAAAGLAAQSQSTDVPRLISVPEGNGAPVITDGIFSPGEWDDALRIPLNETAALYLKEYRDVIFVGVRGAGPSELLVAVPGGPITKLHVSWNLYEVVLPPTGGEPSPRLGLTKDWYASELRRDEALFERLRKEGQKSPLEVIQATNYPMDGLEFAIRRAKFPGRTWLMRLQASVFVEGKPGMITYPAAAPERTTDGWLELRLR